MGFSNKNENQSLSEINVTPMVDVMLVLLIVFMVSAPLLEQGLDIKLPKTSAQAIAKDNAPLSIYMDRSRRLKLEGLQVTLEQAISRLKEAMAADPEKVLLLYADSELTYGTVAQLMGSFRQAGVTKLSLVTDPVDQP